MIGTRAEGDNQKRRARDHRDRDGDQGGTPPGQRGLGWGRSAEQVGGAGQQGDDARRDTEGGIADVERVEQRRGECGGRADGDGADGASEGGQLDCGPRGASGARHAERGSGRVQGQDEHDRPEPRRRRLAARVGAGRALARLRDRNRVDERRERVLLVVHSGLAVAEPRALDPVGPGGARGVGRVRLRIHCEAAYAGGALRDRRAQVGHPRVVQRGAPQSGEALPEHAVAPAARRVGAAHDHSPRPHALGRPAGIDAEPLGLPARVGELVVRQRRPAALREVHGRRQPVRGPVVLDRRPVVLGAVAPGREVGADPVRDPAPRPGREVTVEAGQRPVRLAGEVLRVLPPHRRAARRVVRGQHRAGRLGLSDEEAPESPQHGVVAGVAGGVAPHAQPRGQQRRRARVDGAEADRRPSVTFDQPVERPARAAVGRAQRVRQPGRGRLVQAHRRAGVPNDVVLRGRGVPVLVVEVEPAAVRVLVAREPVDGGLSGGAELPRGDARTPLRRRRHPEREHEQRDERERRSRHPSERRHAGALAVNGEPGARRERAVPAA